MIIDRTPPAPRVVNGIRVLPYNGGPANPQSDLTLFWDGVFSGPGFSGDPESGLVAYYVAWGYEPSDTRVLDWTRVEPPVTSYTLPYGGNWIKGKQYFGTVRAQSGSGINTTLTVAKGQIMDETPVGMLLWLMRAIVPLSTA